MPTCSDCRHSLKLTGEGLGHDARGRLGNTPVIRWFICLTPRCGFSLGLPV